MQTGSAPTPKRTIDRASVLPFYFQLKEIVSDMIRDNHLEPGTRLPSDHELCAAYDLSRTVVRQALAELESEGLIERVKGRGTFVAAPKVAEGLVATLTGLHEDVAARGDVLESEVLRLEIVPADEQIAEELQLELHSALIALERIRSVGGKRWVYTVTHIPFAVAPGLIHEDLRNRSLYRVLEENHGVVIDHATRSVEAVAASKQVARMLEIPVGAPVLLLRSTSVDATGRCIESFVAYHRGDRSRFVVSLSRSGSGPTAPEIVMK